MRTSQPYARVLLLIASALPFAAAAEQPIDEIIVRGTPSEIVLDDSALRIDLRRHVSRIARSVRNALGSAANEPLVATAVERERG